MSRQRLAWLAVLGLGVVALILDRALLGPASANAEATPELSAGSAPSAGVAAKPEDAEIPLPGAAAAQTAAGPSLAERLREAQASIGEWDHASLREAFRPSQAWLSVLVQPAVTEAAQASPDDFWSTVRVTAIVSGRAGAFVRAVIGEQTWVIPVGGQVQGLRLVSVDDSGRSALFERNGEEVRLRLEEPRLGGREQAAPATPASPFPPTPENPDAERPQQP